MIGVIVLSGPLEEMHGLDADRSPSLLPLGDRPALQHIIESLVTQGINRIELIVSHGPERVEELLGNGDRWGCIFRYHLTTQPEYPYRSLKIIDGLGSESWALIHAERFPCVDFNSRVEETTTLYFGSFIGPAGKEGSAAEPDWGGSAVMMPAEITDEMASYSREELHRFLVKQVQEKSGEIVRTDDWIDVSSPASLLDSQARLLDKKLRGLLISGAERQPGIWVARNATIHPSARLTPPLYIGTNTRLSKGVKAGPYAVIGPDCIIDSNTVLDHALIFEGSYVGEGLEVHQSIVAHNLLVNVRLNASVDITENFLLGRLDRPRPSGAAGRGLQSLIAILLSIVFLPVTLCAWIYFALFRGIPFTATKAVCLPVDEKPLVLETFSLPCFGADAWTTERPAGWGAFCRQFLPGLLAVAKGNLGLVGLPPRTAAQVAELDEDWRAMYFAGRPGLITEAATAATDSTDAMQMYLADAYYSVQKGVGHNAGLAMHYFTRLIFPKQF